MYAADDRVLGWAKQMIVRGEGAALGAGFRPAPPAQSGSTDACQHSLLARCPQPLLTPLPSPQASSADRQLKPIQRVWIYMPFMHSEQLADQEVSPAPPAARLQQSRGSRQGLCKQQACMVRLHTG